MGGWMMSVLPGWLVSTAPSLQERMSEWGWGMHPRGGVWGARGLGMMLMGLIFWAGVIVLIVLGIRWLASQGREPRPDTALDILRQRYARGEISKEEFDSKRQDLASR
jgi:putative membrane protein